ncbi:hypothetical protein LCGC14_0774110 [marine sediment metagenome]|uniref:Uncharacterized protein n=1 Tax=marine sediment metagenome TaxID=412755 RepID=A0A0F9T4C2_9ZZZZ
MEENNYKTEITIKLVEGPITTKQDGSQCEAYWRITDTDGKTYSTFDEERGEMFKPGHKYKVDVSVKGKYLNFRGDIEEVFPGKDKAIPEFSVSKNFGEPVGVMEVDATGQIKQIHRTPEQMIACELLSKATEMWIAQDSGRDMAKLCLSITEAYKQILKEL